MREDKLISDSSPNPNSPNSQNQWESNYAEEIENYFHHLLSLNLDEVDYEQENNDISQKNCSPMEAEMKKLQTTNMVNLTTLFIYVFGF